MAITIEQKKLFRKSVIIDIGFSISLILLLLTVSSYFLLDYFSKKELANLNNLKATLAGLRSPENIALEQKLASYQAKISDFSEISSKFYNTPKLFELFEKVTHPKVWFTQAKLNLKESKVELAGVVDTFFSLGQQMLTLKANASLSDINLSGVVIGEKREIKFVVSFSFDPEIIK